MCCVNYWKRIVPFALALVIGVFTAGIFEKFLVVDERLVAPPVSIDWRRSAAGSGGYGGGSSRELAVARAGTNPVHIIFKPRPAYTDAARVNQVTGIVRLRVVFLASGQIGSVTPVCTLPDGLTEKAMAAALNIRFEPATKDDKPVSVIRNIEYNFSIY